MCHYAILAVLIAALLTVGGCTTDPTACPDESPGEYDAALQPVDLGASAGQLQFRFQDQRTRPGCTYQFNLHQVYAECVGTAEPFSTELPAGDPGEYVITVPCESFASLNLYVASWSVSVLGGDGATLVRSAAVPITVPAMARIRAACGE